MSNARGSNDEEPHYVVRDQGLPGLSRLTRDQLELVAEGLELRLRDVKHMSMYDLRNAIADHDKTAWVLYGKAGCSIVPVCDCKHPASIFAVSKAGRNNGKLFRVCRKERDDPTRCNFFQWDEKWRANRNTAAAAEPPASAAAAEPPAAAAAEPPAETTYEPKPETRRSNIRRPEHAEGPVLEG